MNEPLYVVQGIKTNNLLDSAVGHLLAEIKSLVRLNLLSFECVFVGRTGNGVAHELARLGSLCNEGEQIISSVLPVGIDVMVANDVLAVD